MDLVGRRRGNLGLLKMIISKVSTGKWPVGTIFCVYCLCIVSAPCLFRHVRDRTFDSDGPRYGYYSTKCSDVTPSLDYETYHLQWRE